MIHVYGGVPGKHPVLSKHTWLGQYLQSLNWLSMLVMAA